MNNAFFKKFISLIIICGLVSGFLSNVFIKKAAATSAGASFGAAVGAGVACFLEGWLELKVQGLFGEAEGAAGAAIKSAPADIVFGIENIISVPVLDRAAFTLQASGQLWSQETTHYKGQIDTAFDKSRDCMRDVLAKMILDWLTDQIVQWIQGGGEPLFVSDWKGFLNEAANTAIGRVIQESDLAFLCSPLRYQLKLSLLPGRSFRDRIGCTLDDVIANIENFYEDFTRGGWIAYNRLWEPQNNYYGARLILHDEILTRAAEAQEAAKNEALAGSGFLSVKKCKKYDEEKYNKCLEATENNTELCPREDESFCLEYEIQTPGSIVGRAAGEAITSDIKWAENIKSWVAAIVNAVINRLITDGLSLMKGSYEPYESSDYSDYNPYGDYYGTTFLANGLSDMIDMNKKFRDGLQEVLPIKQESYTYMHSIFLCLFSTASSEGITSLISREQTIAGAVTQYQTIIAELNLLLIEAENVSSNDPKKLSEIAQKLSDFMSKNSSLYLEVINGAAKQNAQKELDSLKSEASSACPQQ